MGPKHAWGAFSLIIVLADAGVTAVLINAGIDALPIVALAMIALLVYFYVLYKRYHVEVVPEHDIRLFDDPDDLRILCNIYGLDASGDADALRDRLLRFARANKEDAFAWVAPKVVLSLGSVLEIPPKPLQPGRTIPGAAETTAIQLIDAEDIRKPLMGGRSRSSARLYNIKACPVCDAKAPRKGMICSECGADLEFYSVLAESRVGKLVLSEKAGAVRRKLRYDVPSLEEMR